MVIGVSWRPRCRARLGGPNLNAGVKREFDSIQGRSLFFRAGQTAHRAPSARRAGKPPACAPAPCPSLDPQAEQQRLYESAFSFFVRLTNQAPLLLVLEDVHWADGGTLALVRSLARRFRQTHTPVLIVLTFREVELNEHKGLADLLTTWHRDRLAHTLKLHRFDRQGTQAVLEALLAEEVTPEFADRVYRETEGNPFFIEEMCKALIEGGQGTSNGTIGPAAGIGP